MSVFCDEADTSGYGGDRIKGLWEQLNEQLNRDVIVSNDAVHSLPDRWSYVDRKPDPITPKGKLLKLLGLTEEEYDSSTNGRLERWLRDRFRMFFWNNIMLSDDEYINIMKQAMKCQRSEEAIEILNKLGAFVRSESEPGTYGSHNDPSYLELGRARVGDIAYFAGYYDFETRMRVERLFDTEHHVAGNYIDNGDSNEYLLAKAAEWDNILLRQELQEQQEKKEKKELEDKLRVEAEEELSRGINHHSNKVRRRSVKFLNEILKKTGLS